MNQYIRMRLANQGKGNFRAEGNTLWLYDVIAADDDEAMWWGGISPSRFIAELEKTTGPVTLRINSPGGSVFGAQAMVAAMRSHPHQITAKIDSLAASAASVIAAACNRTVMVPGSMQMIHRAWGVAVGNCQDMRSTADLLEKIDGLIAGSYAARAGDKADKDRFYDLMAAETWFTPEEAIAVGLADDIAAENTQRAQMLWDLSAFAAAPKLDAPEEEPGETESENDVEENEDAAATSQENDQDEEMIAAAAKQAQALRVLKARVETRLNPI